MTNNTRLALILAALVVGVPLVALLVLRSTPALRPGAPLQLVRAVQTAVTLAPLDPRCPTPHTPGFSSSATAPVTGHTVCLVDVGAAGQFELYTVPVGAGSSAGAVRVSAPFTCANCANRDVIRFAVSPLGDRVAFTCDAIEWTKYELYSAPILGGAVTKLSGVMLHEHDVDDFAFSLTGARVVYRKGRNTTGIWALYSAPAVGGGSAQLSQPMQPAGSVQGMPDAFTIINGDRVRYSADVVDDEVYAWYVVGVAGPPPPVMREVFADGFESGDSSRWN